MIEVMNIVIDRSRCIVERLSQVLFFQERILPYDLPTVVVGGKNFQYAANGDPHSTNARFAPTLSRFDSDAFKRWKVTHVFILQGFSDWRARRLTSTSLAANKVRRPSKWIQPGCSV